MKSFAEKLGTSDPASAQLRAHLLLSIKEAENKLGKKGNG